MGLSCPQRRSRLLDCDRLPSGHCLSVATAGMRALTLRDMRSLCCPARRIGCLASCCGRCTVEMRSLCWHGVSKPSCGSRITAYSCAAPAAHSSRATWLYVPPHQPALREALSVLVSVADGVRGHRAAAHCAAATAAQGCSRAGLCCASRVQVLPRKL